MVHAPHASPTDHQPANLIDIVIGVRLPNSQKSNTEAYFDLANLALLLADKSDSTDDVYILTHYLLHLAHSTPGKHLNIAIQAAIVSAPWFLQVHDD